LRFGLDKLGVLIAALAVWAAFAPFVSLRANRIAAAVGQPIPAALPTWAAVPVLAVLALATVLALLRCPAWARFVAAATALLALALAIGIAPGHLVEPGDRLARVSPTAGFWIGVFAFALLAADAMTRLGLGPLARVLALLAVTLILAALLVSGLWDGLGILREYANRDEAFWREGARHVELAFGSLLAALLAGIPLGLLCHRVPRLRAGTLGVLNAVQTVPSIALFGLLIAPLAWLSAAVPLAAALGIGGIGAAPAFVALFLYSLLPITANTVVGLGGVPAAVTDAGRGMGLTAGQRLAWVELPLALPVILAGIRIVLVQNIGMTTIAALIGGGGFGVFVFQGLGQTSVDLMLLGVIPTVALAFAAGLLLDACIAAARRRGRA